jgi:hypothetical protein
VRSPIGWWWPALAGIAIVVAALAGANYALAVPAATVAVVAGSLTVIDALGRHRGPLDGPILARPLRPGGVRGAFRGGEVGREDIVLTLDLLERKLARPDLPSRTGPELAEICRRPPEQFRRYLAERLAGLEGDS